MQQPEYKFYATLLDAFTNYLKSDAIYEKYWKMLQNLPFQKTAKAPTFPS